MRTNKLTRKPYRRSDYAYLAQNYENQPARALAKALGRTPASLYEYISRHPELRKRGKN